jgi:hypothetical protein
MLWTWIPPFPSKVNGHNSRKEKVVKSEIKLGIPL